MPPWRSCLPRFGSVIQSSHETMERCAAPGEAYCAPGVALNDESTAERHRPVEEDRPDLSRGVDHGTGRPGCRRVCLWRDRARLTRGAGPDPEASRADGCTR